MLYCIPIALHANKCHPAQCQSSGYAYNVHVIHSRYIVSFFFFETDSFFCIT